MQDFDFDSWTPPTSPVEEQGDFTDWIPPTRPIRGARGLGEEVEGKLPPLASEVEKEEFPFTGPMPFSLRENAFRGAQSIKPGGEPILPENLEKYFGGGPLDPGATQSSKVGSVLDFGSRLIHGQQKDSSGRPLAGSITPEGESVLPKMTSQPDTWLGGFGQGLYNEFGRNILNPDAILGSIEPGPATAKTALGDFLKVGESPIGRLVSKARGIKPKTPADVAALEAQLKGTLSEPFRPGALETGPIAPVDLSTGIPKPRIDAATFAQMRNEASAAKSRAEAAANAAKVAPDPQASVATRPLAGMNPQPAPRSVQPRVRLRELIEKDVAGQLTGPELDEARILYKQEKGRTFPLEEPAPVEAMPETAIPEAPITAEQSLVESPIEAMPEMDSRISSIEPPPEPIPEAPPEELMTPRSELPPVEAIPEETSWFGEAEAPVPQEQSLAVPERAIEPEVMPLGTDMGEEELDMWGYPKSRDLTDEEVETIKRQMMKDETQYFGPDMVENQEAADAMTGNIEVMPEETKKIIAETRQANDEGYAVYPPGYRGEIYGDVIRELSDGSKVVDNAPRALPEAPSSISAMPEESPWVGEEIEAPKPKTKAELKAERIAAKREKVANKWAGVSKPSEGPAKLLTKGEIGTIESLPRETPTPKPKELVPIEDMPIGSLPGEEGITEGIITSQDKADFRAREEEMRKALEGKTRASESGTLEERPSWISEEGEDLSAGISSEDKETSRAKAEEMKRALEGKKRAGSRMSMPEMGRAGELPKETPKATSTRPKPQTTSERWQSQVDALDKAKAPDIQYQEILSTGTKTPLRKKETWRERVLGYIDLQKQNEAKQASTKSASFSERLKGEKGAAIISGKGPGPLSMPSGPPVPPPPFSWKSTGGKGIGSKGPLDILRGSKFGKAVGKAYGESEFESPVTKALDVAGNTMKSMMSTGDLSGALRQGGALVHKKEWREAVPKMIEMFKDEAVYTKRMGNIKKDPLFKFANDMGLNMTGINAGKEERFASDIGHSIPGFGKLSKASDNAFTGFQNELRFSTFKTLLQDATNAGLKPGRDKELAKEIASFVNEATGRGSLGKVGEPMARLANSVIYSPRLGMSRWQMIRRVNPLDPKFYSQGKFVRKEAIKSAFALAGMNLAANAATAAIGGTVTYNILNSDFMKNKFGNTRVDMGAGFLQPVVLAARIATEKYTSSTSGKTYELGTDYGQTSTGDLLWRFLQSKEAPIAGLVAELYSGKDWQGKDKNRAIAAAERFTPLILQDMYDIIKEDPRMAPLIVPGFFGASVQTYGKPEKKQKLSMPKMGL